MLDCSEVLYTLDPQQNKAPPPLPPLMSRGNQYSPVVNHDDPRGGPPSVHRFITGASAHVTQRGVSEVNISLVGTLASDGDDSARAKVAPCP